MKEQLYTDFVNNVLPKLQEGMTMTFEYFTDLFGRYVTYLFITDVIAAILCFIAFAVITLVFISKKYRVWFSEANDDYNPMGFITLIFGGIAAMVFFGFAVDNTFNAIKAKYIPEVRVYEEVQYMRNLNSN